MKLLKRLSIIFLVVIVLLLGTVAFLLGTQTGLHFLINTATKWVPGLVIADVSGGLRDLTLKGVSYQMPGIKVDAGQFHLSLNFSCLKNSELCVNALTAKDVDVAVNSNEMSPPQEPQPESEPLSPISTPYPIDLKLLRVENLNVTVDDMAISLAEFRTGARWQETQLSLIPTQIKTLLVVLPDVVEQVAEEVAQNTEEAAQEIKESVKLDDKPTPEPVEPLGEKLKALFDKPLLETLPDVVIPLDITAEEIVGEAWRVTGGGNDYQLDRLELGVVTKASHVQLQKLNAYSPQGNLSLQGDAELAKEWPLNLSLDSTLNIEPLQGENVSLNLQGGLKSPLKLTLKLSGTVAAELEAQAELAEAGLPLSLALKSKELRWPLTGESQYQIKNLDLALNGKATDYQLALHSDIRGVDLPPAALSLDGKGNVEQFALELLRLSALEGTADVKGVVDWSQAISWNSKLTLTGINTAKQWPEWPARLQGNIETRGSLYGGSWQLAVPVLKLTGNVKQNDVDINGSLKGNAAGQWDIPGLKIALGKNEINAKGSLSETWNLDADINAPHLDGALPGLGGVASGSVKLRGDINAPQLLADLSASRLKWQELSVERVKLKADVRSAEQIKGILDLQVDQIKQGDLQITSLSLDAKGDEKQHQLQLNMKGEPVSGQLALKGSFSRENESWQGTLSDTKFDTPVGEMALQRSMVLGFQNGEDPTVSVGPHCWNNKNAELCVPEKIVAGASGKAGVVLKRFDLAMITPFLTEDTKLKGVFTGRADVSWSAAGGLPQAKVVLDGKGIEVRQMVEGEFLPLQLDTLTLNAGVNNNNVQLDWLAKIAGNGAFSGKVSVTDPQGRRNLSGNIRIDAITLDLIKPILVSNEKAKGSLDADLRIAGTAQAPEIFGRLALSKLDLDASWLPFDVKEGHLGVNFAGMSSTLDGLIKTSNGQLNLTGNADWRKLDAWRASVSAKGDRLRVTVPPMIRIDVSPDVQLDATPQMLSLNGHVDIPWARITVQELPESAVSVSSDEVMLDDQLQPVETQTASIPINSNLTIHIGDNVRLDAFGLKARLEGDLKVAQDKRGLGLNGQVDIPSGRFHAYGQDLIIRKGLLLFSGPPDQPILNIEAIRNPEATEDDVTAGVKVTGLADEPKVEIFSDPVMTQEEALSYLLRGQGLDTSAGDSGVMTSMLISLGVAKSGKLVGKIGDAFGVSNLSLDTAGVGDSSQVVVSGYIMPGLQVKYGVGIFDSLATLTLRYRLMPKLYLEAVSGIDQSLDLLYQFEF